MNEIEALLELEKCGDCGRRGCDFVSHSSVLDGSRSFSREQIEEIAAKLPKLQAHLETLLKT